MIDVNAILSKAKQIGASDAHFIPGIKPTLRINRDLVELDEYENISKEDVERKIEILQCMLDKKAITQETFDAKMNEIVDTL